MANRVVILERRRDDLRVQIEVGYFHVYWGSDSPGSRSDHLNHRCPAHDQLA